MVAECFETALVGGEPYAIDVRVVWPDGSLHWLFTRRRFLRDDDGVPLRVAGVVGDITKRGGSGLGLATVHGITAAADGDVRISSTPGQGTTISVRFPVCDDPCEARELLEPDADVTRSGLVGRRVIVVDDQESIRTLVEHVLRGAGCDVHAGTAREIVEMSHTATVAPDLLLTDVTMPDLSGSELARILSRQWPSLTVLYMSGYGGEALDSFAPGTTSETPSLLSKPFSSHDLLRAVTLALQSADTTQN